MGSMDRAFERLYNFDFPGAHRNIDQFISENPNDPFGYAIRSSAYLFYELDRLAILDAEFFADDEKIADKRKKLEPDPALKAKLFKATEDSQTRAKALLKQDPNHVNALFAMCITEGVITDYTALVEKKQFKSLSTVKTSAAYGAHLLKIQPTFYDAYVTTGLADYLIGSLPFFVRWFVRIEHVSGDKSAGIDKLKLVAEKGRFFKPFAKILLSIAYLREKQPTKAQTHLAELKRQFPENPLFQREYVRVSAKLQSGELKDQDR